MEDLYQVLLYLWCYIKWQSKKGREVGKELIFWARYRANHFKYMVSLSHHKFSSVLLLRRVRLFATPWTATRQASLFITSSQSLPKLMSIESVMPSSHLILCRPLLLLPSIFPSIRVFSNESALCIRWPKYWCFSFSISLPMIIQGWFPLGLTGLTSLSLMTYPNFLEIQMYWLRLPLWLRW